MPSRAEVLEVARRTAERLDALLRKSGRSLEREVDEPEPELVLDEPGLASCYAAAAQGISVCGERAGRKVRELLLADASDDIRARRIDLWVVLIEGAGREVWGTRWNRMQHDCALSRTIWMAVASRVHRDVGELLSPLTPISLPTCISGLWANSQSRSVGGDQVGSGPMKADFRDAVVVHLRQRSDPRSPTCTRPSCEALPQVPFIRMHRVLARRAIAQGTWLPVDPRTLHSVVEEARSRVVESEEQLLAVVLESLERFQRSLNGELSAVRDLWDKGEGGNWRPVDEAALSNRIARHLETTRRRVGSS